MTTYALVMLIWFGEGDMSYGDPEDEFVVAYGLSESDCVQGITDFDDRLSAPGIHAQLVCVDERTELIAFWVEEE